MNQSYKKTTDLFLKNVIKISSKLILNRKYFFWTVWMFTVLSTNYRQHKRKLFDNDAGLGKLIGDVFLHGSELK